MTKEVKSQQLDLFEKLAAETKAALPPNLRTLALDQIQTLLLEAAAIAEPGPEVGDEQDHA